MSGVRTPGLLFVAETGQDDGCSPETVIRGMGGSAGVAVAIDFGANNPGMREANAQRLVACWNALDGLSDDHLAGGWNVRGMSSYAKGLEEKLAAARVLLSEAVKPHDDHLAALKAAGEQPVINPLSVRINNFLNGGAT
ncbi:hypothetical protein [Janthinobacterium sp. SUN206]|uniref:hypothetical protein n=1 Tax=Janthinobacterium sp. SUN206 TaxID=3014787 RepID=UPI0027126810|nr:hypothetical protein [Janthinobacterium sp. SUN206]MDO8065615.1 hypothetical protein [Janthinobacterium sp. SUN206]